ncbi:MAG: acyl carrier protein [Opitutales bacterium]|nr:acyl carrier protein [Opitutales bacterium]
MNNDISVRLDTVFKSTLALDNVPAGLSQKNCEAWDSVNHLNLILALEAEFGVSFEPEEIAAMQDLDTVKKLLAAKL